MKQATSGNVDEVVEIGKGHPRRQPGGNDPLQRQAGLKSKKPLVKRNQSLVAVRGNHQQRRVTPEGVVHQQNDEKWKPVADDFPKRADKIPRPFTPGGRTVLSRHKVMDQFLGEQQRYRRDDDEDVGGAEVSAFQAVEDDSEEEVEKEKSEGDQILQPHVEREARATGHRALSAPRTSAARAEGMEISPSHRARPAPAADRRQDNRRAPEPSTAA